MGWIVTQRNQILLLVIVLCSLFFSSFSLSTLFPCRIEEKTALLQFMSHLSFNASSNCDSSIPPWNEEDDCCDWGGVGCDYETGHVLTLGVGGRCLYGNLPSNNSIFNLLHLERLYLSGINFNNSRVSPLFGNLKNLTHLYLDNCFLYGVLPNELFKLENLQVLNISGNNFSNSRVSPLFGNLKNLTELYLGDCEFSGVLPNEIFKLRKLGILDLSRNKRLTGKLPETIKGLESLQELHLGGCRFYGSIPTSIGKLRKLFLFNITNNNFSGEVPSSLSNLQNLGILVLSYNNLQGPILPSVINLTGCYYLDLSVNKFNDSIDLNLFTNFSGLQTLYLSDSGISLATSNSGFLSALPKIESLGLSSCNLNSNILKYLSAENQLVYVDLSNNEIREELHPSICNLQFIYYLDLSNNQLNGLIPSCLANSSRTLSILNLGNNKFHGPIPQSFGYARSIKVLDLSRNFLQGYLPRSLVNCTELEVLNLGSNILSDGFPYWLGSLSSLKVVMLRDNELNGTLKQTRFANLHIIDMSHNDFTGTFPSHFFDSFNAMMIVSQKDASTYSSVHTNFQCDSPHIRCSDYNMDNNQTYNDYYSLNIMNKGSLLSYKRVLTTLKVVDFSNNKLNDNIPTAIGRLKGIQVLNLSRNSLRGSIPWSVGNLTNLESLDLFDNMFSGQIPQVLSKLSFLEVLDLSQNNLTGVIPGFLDKFPNASFEKNPGLCGLPLSRLCNLPDKPLSSPPIFPTRKKHRFTFDVNDFGWEIVLIGYGCGMVFGLGIGSSISIRKNGWVARAFNL